MTTATSQDQLLLNKTIQYFDEDPARLDKFVNIVNGNSCISLRVLDWFVTNYSKMNNIFVKKSNGKSMNVFKEYKLMLKSFSKKKFDPFCRWNKISIPYKDAYIETTVGQLNFFKWVIDTNIINYVVDHYSDIEIHMSSVTKQRKIDAIDVKLKNEINEEVNIRTTQTVINNNVEIKVKFL